jgi:predicted RNase H-like HicB family nuclease
MSQERVYTGVVRKSCETDYWVDFPDIVGCIVGAPSLEALKIKAPVVLQKHIDELVKAGVEINMPSSPHSILTSQRDSYSTLINIIVNVPDNSNNVRLLNGRHPELHLKLV